MALLMEPGVEPSTEEEKADFEAMNALREEAAIELKEQGNEFLRKGKKFYADALDCYTRAIDQKAANALNNSVLYSNRAQANLLAGNYRRAINDAKAAIQLNPANVKASYRGAKAALALKLWPEAAEFCSEGLKKDPNNEELKKLEVETQQGIADESKRKERALETKTKIQALVSGISARNIRVGKTTFLEHIGRRKPYLDDSGLLHWPVLLLYPEVMVSDIIEDFLETDLFRQQLDPVFGKGAPPLSWDKREEYNRDSIELYYKTNVGSALSEKQLLKSMLEDEGGTQLLELLGETQKDDSEEETKIPAREGKNSRYERVEEMETLHAVLQRRHHIIPGVPMFYVVATGTTFRGRFLSGRWSIP